ncbi:MAG TPA: magnesium transporter [Thermomicrobiales bacterium]|nr:magnesium transporter [Thermomicrobiales bacterium]
MDGALQQSTASPEANLDRLREAIDQQDSLLARALARQLLDEDAAELFEGLDRTEIRALAALLGDETLADLLSQLDEHDAADILEQLPIQHAADVLEEINPDDAADIIVQVDPDVSEDILVAMEPADAAEIRELMAYRPDTAGGIMTPEFVAMEPGLRADRAIAALRKVAEAAETIYYVYITDAEEHLLGVLSLYKLVLSRPDALVEQLMFPDPVRVNVNADQEYVARLLTERNFLAIPVVDDENRLVGIVTADDVADVLEDEATEDIERLGGSAPLSEPYLRASPVLLFRKRIAWLLVLFMAQFVTLEVYDHYQGILEEQLILAMFVPILIGTGGNVGSQTVTTIIRAMAVGEAAPRHFVRILGKEMVTSLGLGLVMGTLMFARGAIQDGRGFGLTVGLTVGVLIIWAATVGAMLPLILSKLRVDPAVVSAPFISSLIDATGLIIYFSMAGLILHVG